MPRITSFFQFFETRRHFCKTESFFFSLSNWEIGRENLEVFERCKFGANDFFRGFCRSKTNAAETRVRKNEGWRMFATGRYLRRTWEGSSLMASYITLYAESPNETRAGARIFPECRFSRSVDTREIIGIFAEGKHRVTTGDLSNSWGMKWEKEKNKEGREGERKRDWTEGHALHTRWSKLPLYVQILYKYFIASSRSTVFVGGPRSSQGIIQTNIISNYEIVKILLRIAHHRAIKFQLILFTISTPL